MESSNNDNYLNTIAEMYHYYIEHLLKPVYDYHWLKELLAKTKEAYGARVYTEQQQATYNDNIANVERLLVLFKDTSTALIDCIVGTNKDIHLSNNILITPEKFRQAKEDLDSFSEWLYEEVNASALLEEEQISSYQEED